MLWEVMAVASCTSTPLQMCQFDPVGSQGGYTSGSGADAVGNAWWYLSPPTPSCTCGVPSQTAVNSNLVCLSNVIQGSQSTAEHSTAEHTSSSFECNRCCSTLDLSIWWWNESRWMRISCYSVVTSSAECYVILAWLNVIVAWRNVIELLVWLFTDRHEPI